MKFHIEVNDWGSLMLFWLSEWGRSEETQHVSGCFMSAEKKGGSQNDTPACRRCSHESLWSKASLGPKKAYSMIGERALWECLVYLGVFTVYDQVSHRLHVPVQDQRSRKTTIHSEMRSASWPNFSLAFITHNLCCMINSMLIFYINFV